MTSPAFNTVLVRDSRLNDITDSLTVPVFQGASQNTYQRINAESQNSSSIQFNVNPPSESIVIDRHILIQSDITFRFIVSYDINTLADRKVINFGVSDAFQAFPLNKLFNTVSVQINNTNVTLNQKDIIDMLLLTYDAESLNECEGLTPYLRDQKYGNLQNSGTVQNSSIGSEYLSDLNGISPRGSFEILSVSSTRVAGIVTTQNVFFTVAGAQVFTIDVTARFIEPLFLSPFITCKKSSKNNQGFLGINNMSFVFNMDPTASRAFSRIEPVNATTTISINNVQNTQLLVNYLSTNALDKIKANNSIPYYDFPRYLTLYQQGINNGITADLNSSNIQLNQVPELIMIGVRKTMSKQNIFDAAAFLTIDRISVNFNNASGLLSNASRADLYYMSKSNGSKQSWVEWSNGISINNIDVNIPTVLNSILSPLGNVLFINPAKDLSLPPFISAGSIGQYNLQFQLSVRNNSGVNYNAGDLEIVTVVMNGGMFSTFSGSSSTYVGLLNKELVLKTGGESEAIGSSSVEEMIGGNIANRVSSAIGGLLPRLGFRGMNKPMPNARSMNMPSSSNSKLDRFA